MKYYKLLVDDDNSIKDIVCYAEENYEEKYEFTQYDLCKGVYFEQWNENFTFYYDSTEGDNPTDYLANNLGWFLISSKFKKILEGIGIQSIQYLPVKVKQKNGNQELSGYFVANIIVLVDALNLAQSIYTEFHLDNEKILSIKKYALNKNKIENLHVLRLIDYNIPIFVSEDVKKEIKNNNITGCDLLEILII
ncbi:MAG: DUF1629 domain-containing protein [Halanaerobiales bacterium]|nr:DUF1629 domain-containing protein [Halanaerobiales bacterium]